MRLIRSISAAVTVASALTALLVAPLRAEELTISILHTTDLHGALAAWDDLTDKPAARGLEKLASLLASARAEGHPTLLLDGEIGRAHV